MKPSVENYGRKAYSKQFVPRQLRTAMCCHPPKIAADHGQQTDQPTTQANLPNQSVSCNPNQSVHLITSQPITIILPTNKPTTQFSQWTNQPLDPRIREWDSQTVGVIRVQVDQVVL